MKYIAVIVLLVSFAALNGQSEQYDRQLGVIKEMLAGGNYKAATAQSRGLVTAGREAHLPLVEAEALFLQGKSLALNPLATAKDKVEGIKFLKAAAQIYRRERIGSQVDSITMVVARLTGSEDLTVDESAERRERRRTRLKDLPSANDIDEEALNAIVSLQEKEILALNDSQLRQLVILEQKNRLLDDYAFKSLEDSVQLIKQEQALSFQTAQIKEERQRRNFFILLAVATAVLLGLLYLRFRSSRAHEAELEEQNAVIEIERQRSDDLLLNILPAPIAQELKKNGRAEAKKYESATIMFADFKGFSALAKTMPPERLIGLLDEAFQAFDRIVEKHGIEKIKTIGDAYMCASGIPLESDDHAERCVAAALDMQDYLSTNQYFSARIGIHTGPVVAGVVGLRKFVYDVWGDTVNQAARLETAGTPGRVAVSESTQALLPADYILEEAGIFEAKNIGPMKRYFVS